MQKNKLSEMDRYELSIRVQAPLYYFVAENFPFSIHHWDVDKTAVLRKQEKDYYRIHPLRRDDSVATSLPIFDFPVKNRLAHATIDSFCPDRLTSNGPF